MAKHEILDQVSRLIGMQGAITLTRRYGGKTLSFPSVEKLNDSHPLVLTIGLEPAQKLSREFGRELIELPFEVNALRELRNAEIVRLFVKDGRSIRSLSIDFGIDRAYIQKIIDKAGHRQLRISRSGAEPKPSE